MTEAAQTRANELAQQARNTGFEVIAIEPRPDGGAVLVIYGMRRETRINVSPEGIRE